MIAKTAASLKASDFGDKIMPHFMVTQLPVGALGLDYFSHPCGGYEYN